MPRMYMAIAREDRFPITDIMRQTPGIPANCQWAIFLRNHDELTLEMVTDSERDYLWETYAADRRARLNLGIRRRLAPLLQRDRRRIELMNGLLLSMPGTPVIYYGDEIGMGDNIHLGDRDGVRTPMQWSPDRNGGFSRADPASLVLPPIMDAMYGYEAVNVEAQIADQHSLLNWTRRMLAVRSRHQAFGRGTLRFLYPGNRKVLAFLRELRHEDGTDETILCVSNLSRSAQAVELDISAFAGRVPVDIVGGSAFPPVGQLTYLLTLPPYGFFWFLLAAQAQLPAWHVPAPEAMPEFATLVVRHRLEDLLTGNARSVLENEVLPAYLPKRRWFASKGERLDRVRIAYAVRLPDTDGAVLLAEIEAELEGRSERYALPLGLGAEDAPGPLVQQLALTRLRRGREVGYLTDAFAIDAFAYGVVSALRKATRLSIDGGGELRFTPTSLMQGLDLPDGAEIRRLSAEQSNSSLVVGDRLVLKIVRRVAAGVHPEGEMTRYLTESGYANSAPLYGEMVRVDADGTPNTFGLVQGFVRNQGDGWGYTLDFLAREAEEMAVTTDGQPADPDAFRPYLSFAAAMGRRLGELHEVLSRPTENADFAPEPADTDTLRGWAEGAIEQVDGAFALLRGMKEWPDEAAGTLAAALLARADEISRLAHRLASEGRGALQTRVHGDFHLGQVLVVQGDAYIIDFEGEPARPMEQRRRKSSPLRDVAGLIRSFDYATATAAPGRTAASAQTAERRAALLQQFREETGKAFSDAYRAVLEAAPNPWVPADAARALVFLFLIEKAAYEIRYEAANRPGWLGIPLLGLTQIIDRVPAARETAPA
jgi:maltose alpha-D-glucosyltransferase/alpha-amylase